MNSDFPRIITLLRKERGISQKNAALDLGISQALLSHYEKGIRECGLDFLVKAADYYHVSCDYLLGRSPEPEGKTISYGDISSHSDESASGGTSDIMSAFSKKLIVNSANVLFSLIVKTGSEKLLQQASAYLMLAIYKLFRIIFTSGRKNDAHFFTVPEATAHTLASAAMSVAEAKATVAASECDGQYISAGTLSEEYAANASSLLNIIKNSEAIINGFDKPDKPTR